ncbi:MAG: hypothetical protein HY539_01615 [Deltaproteobacteria bacterium]|nr:hypothetical protein [Deltaproteobacteria bacterium]
MGMSIGLLGVREADAQALVQELIRFLKAQNSDRGLNAAMRADPAMLEVIGPVGTYFTPGPRGSDGVEYMALLRGKLNATLEVALGTANGRNGKIVARWRDGAFAWAEKAVKDLLDGSRFKVGEFLYSAAEGGWTANVTRVGLALLIGVPIGKILLENRDQTVHESVG